MEIDVVDMKIAYDRLHTSNASKQYTTNCKPCLSFIIFVFVNLPNFTRKLC